MEKVSYLPQWPENPLTLKIFEHLKNEFEADGQQAVGVHLTTEQAGFLRWEIHQLYGRDLGEELPTLFGLEVLSRDAPELRFVAP
ncbi:MAG: hypothetical protein HQM04_10115 [Magnetococcales bacterium]|nr:hypothetical protein [Magnetococcales bacterium]MBF0115385.1 hypothetical protein [Magnetococcales bacterium]